MRILLLCYGGLSTGLMKQKIEEEAQKDGYEELEIKALSLSEVEHNLGDNDYDVYLLAPQVRYAAEDFQSAIKDKPVIIISSSDFGLMRGDNVWKQIKKVIK